MTVQYQSYQAFGPHHPKTHIIELNNPHYYDGDSGSNPDGRSLLIYACSVNSLIIKIIFFGGTASDSVIIHLLATFACTEDTKDVLSLPWEDVLSLPWVVFLLMILERAASEHVLMRIFLASRLSMLE